MRTREIGNDKHSVTKASGHSGLPDFGQSLPSTIQEQST